MKSLPSYGLLLPDWEAPSFMAATKADQAKEFEPLFPYTPVIRNDSERAVIAYCVTWNWPPTAAEGPAKGPAREIRTVFNFSDPLRSRLCPHTTQVVSMLRSLESGLSTLDRFDLRGIAKLVDQYSEDSGTLITLEALLFDDGTAVGRTVLDGFRGGRQNWWPPKKFTQRL